MYKDAPVVYRSSEEIRELIIDWVERNKTVPATPNNNWRIVPTEPSPGARVVLVSSSAPR